MVTPNYQYPVQIHTIQQSNQQQRKTDQVSCFDSICRQQFIVILQRPTHSVGYGALVYQ